MWSLEDFKMTCSLHYISMEQHWSRASLEDNKSLVSCLGVVGKIWVAKPSL